MIDDRALVEKIKTQYDLSTKELMAIVIKSEKPPSHPVIGKVNQKLHLGLKKMKFDTIPVKSINSILHEYIKYIVEEDVLSRNLSLLDVVQTTAKMQDEKREKNITTRFTQDEMMDIVSYCCKYQITQSRLLECAAILLLEEKESRRA